uniref:hypothetical protein n=1 Tax=Metallibacterium scheffleri TaxID=993689 RepID=UPI0023F37EF1
AAILARIERRATQILLPNGADRYDFDRDLLSAIERLTNDVALAWDGNVEQRAAHLDPEMYAAEVRQAEYARLGFNDRLNEILDKLAKEIGQRESGKRDDGNREDRGPIFLLPVDDLDLNPMRTLDLLRLLRMAHSPRLLTLALGNLALVDTVLAAKYFGEFTEPFRHATGTSVWPVSQEEIAQAARQTTAHALRKLLPP